MAVWKKVIKKLKSGTWFPFYNLFYEKAGIDQRTILLESRGGRGLESNIFALVKELNRPEYSNYRKLLVTGKKERAAIEAKLQKYDLKVDRMVTMGSIPYYYALSTAKYLVNDTSFPGRFIKKKEQIYLNVWHGTPLKHMGRDNKEERYSMGNVMRNLLMSDYLLYPNAYMEEKMTSAYMLDRLYNGKILREGYPRNEIFFQKEKGLQRKRDLGYEGKQLFVYMPTYRAKVDHLSEDTCTKEIQGHLKALDRLLKDDQVLLVKLHPFVEKLLSIEGYRHIKSFPKEYDTYDVLNACDVLITDYSSVFYDFANTGKRILFFAYDRESYAGSRGMYEALEAYPFPIAQTVEELYEALNTTDGIPDEAFLKRYATYENPAASERICRHIFLKEELCTTVTRAEDGKKNILLYGGDFNQNGITTAFFGMLGNLDTEKNNYYVSFRLASLAPFPERLDRLLKEALLCPIASEMNLDVVTAVAQAIYLKTGFGGLGIRKRMQTAYKREWEKHFGSVKFDHAVHYNGYENYMLALFSQAPCPHTIWVHNDMVKETEREKNPSRILLRDAYRSSKHVVTVGENLRKPTQQIGGTTLPLSVIANRVDHEGIRRRAEAELQFEEKTDSTVSCEELKQILDSDAKKFISIGRYSWEKGHDRLIGAFDRYWKTHKDAYLIIIGGTGDLYEKTKALAGEKEAGKNIVLIRSLANPMPVLKKCDLFVLSSHYEGLPLVIQEADVLGIPVMACEIAGLKEYLSQHGGFLTEATEDGLFHGMETFATKPWKAMGIDFEAYNKTSAEKIQILFE